MEGAGMSDKPNDALTVNSTLLAAAKTFATEFRREFHSGQAEHEKWDGWIDGFDPSEPLDAAYLALVDAIGNAECCPRVERLPVAWHVTDGKSRGIVEVDRNMAELQATTF